MGEDKPRTLVKVRIRDSHRQAAQLGLILVCFFLFLFMVWMAQIAFCVNWKGDPLTDITRCALPFWKSRG